MRLVSFSCVVMIVSVALSGCGSAQVPTCDIPEQGNLLIEATERLNLDDEGRALPTIVRIYQLSGLGSLELASFEEIWQHDEETLGETLLVAEELTVYPGQQVRRTFERDPNASYIVGVAIVRRPVGLAWRSVLELPTPAEAQRCAALQEDPEEPPPQPALSRVEFRVDMYTIEGSLLLDESARECEASDLECIRSQAEATSDVERPEAPEAEQPSQPEMPTTPTTPGI